MCSLIKFTLLAILAFLLIGSTSAAPVGAANAGELVARGDNNNAEEGTGACGWKSKNTEHVVAIGGANKSTCGKTATVTYKGKSVKVKVVDECPVCGHNNIDLSPSAFEQLAPKREGKLDGISWKYD
ncbi:hypothetical protein FRC07_015193 [Ceratobasidium sp. 392]|nr:hypothetical protein FRC07_015193 [Ceratobasidium sp. 392]